jgi:hypothetical protein
MTLTNVLRQRVIARQDLSAAKFHRHVTEVADQPRPLTVAPGVTPKWSAVKARQAGWRDDRAASPSSGFAKTPAAITLAN